MFIFTAGLVLFFSFSSLFLLTQMYCLLRIPPHCDAQRRDSSGGTYGQTVASKAFCISLWERRTSFEYIWLFSQLLQAFIRFDRTCFEAQHLSFCPAIIAYGVHKKNQA